ncbi:MAG: C45 family autoproteolytic acyltransferase/hydrolase [Myxococcota bacterium]
MQSAGRSERVSSGAGIRLVTVRGTCAERAAQLGEYLAQDPHAPAEFEYWQQFFPIMVRERMPGAPDVVLRGLVATLERTVLAALARCADDETGDAAEALERAAGQRIRPGRSIRLHVGLDGLAVLGSLPISAHMPRSTAGCSTLVASGDATPHGGLIHGRNFDLPLPTDEPAPPLLVAHHPKDGLRHVSVHHATAFMPGVTGTNEAGITLGVHQHFTTAGSPLGRGVLAQARQVIEHARTLEEARELLMAGRSAAGWCFIVSCARTGRAWAMEVDHHGVATRSMDQCTLPGSNCYTTPARQAREYHLSGAWKEHNDWRLRRLADQATTLRGHWDEQAMALLLGDHGPQGQERAVGRSISAPHNASSWVVSPQRDAVYVALGGWPANNGDHYAGFRLSSLMEGRVERREDLRTAWSDGPYRARRAALQSFVRGVRASFVRWNVNGAAAHFQHAWQTDPTEPIYAFSRGVMDLKLGDHESATTAFAQSESQEPTPYRRHLSALMLGRALDLRGRRAEARAAYQRAASDDVGDAGLTARALRGMRRKFTRIEVRNLIFDHVMADVPN